MNVGNMGSDKRLAWTVMGDNVNLASRLEGMTKEYRSRIIISEFTFRQVAHQFVCREVDKIRVKGKNQPVTIYELMAPIEDRARLSDLLSRLRRRARSLQNARLAPRGRQVWRTLDGVPRRWTNTNPAPARHGIHGRVPRARLGRRLRHEIQIALTRRSYRKSRLLNVGVF